MQSIADWNQIKDDYKDSLITGNGASIAVNQNFSYDSLIVTEALSINNDQITKAYENYFFLGYSIDIAVICNFFKV